MDDKDYVSFDLEWTGNKDDNGTSNNRTIYAAALEANIYIHIYDKAPCINLV
ncbi:MAG: hypothetical protein M3299_12295 [Thermoproteota archaeon]|nr:hypothetical protein [Thermoproteota archaeon]